MIAYHFPPIRHSSGIQRTLKFATYLRDHGWQPIVLTVHPRCYEVQGPDQLGDIPPDVVVERAFAVDAARHLSIKGRYLHRFALPDRWASWVLGGLWSGMRLIRQHRPAVIWSTYPIATAHLIGSYLHRLSGLPWVADFRDSMTEADYPSDPRQRRSCQGIEAQTVHQAQKVVFTTTGTRDMYAERYRDIPVDRWAVIPNGYDEVVFAEVEAQASERPRGGPLRLVHAGIIYPAERDPRVFFQALGRLKAEGRIDANRLRVILRGTAHDHLFEPMLREHGVADIVELAPPVAYREALLEMLQADGLLLFQAPSCNHQIPAKVYEYFRARRPILALTDPAGDTAAALRGAGVGTIVPIDDAELIGDGLMEFIKAIDDGSAAIADDQVVEKTSRASGARDLADFLHQVAEERPP